MSPSSNVPGATAPTPAIGARGLVAWVCTKNPFYVISAGLFLWGLWHSFGKQTEIEESWALVGGLTGYTTLLAVTACLLVRYAKVWDDVRTVLLLVVLMFLATSVTFDEALTLRPALGMAIYLGGLLFAVGVTEGVLRGIRLWMPACFRVPYYLILILFFVYPLVLSPLQEEPQSPEMMWTLFGFSPVAGLVFLTLIPAIRRGPGYVRDNGSPWPWPLYPWSLFVILAMAVPARSFMLCWSMHLVEFREHNQLIFGGYFLVPFGLAATLLLLEMGLVSRSRAVMAAALLAPVLLVVTSSLGHHTAKIYLAFLEEFTARLGGSPLFLTLVASALFYVYAMVRQVPLAAEALTATLAALAVFSPHTRYLDDLAPARAEPLLLAATLQLLLAYLRGASWRCVLGTGLAVAAALTFPSDLPMSPWRGVVAFHVALAAVVLIGALYDDLLARLLRDIAAILVLQACLGVLLFRGLAVTGFPAWAFDVYPPLMALLLVLYARRLEHPLSVAAAILIVTCWVASLGWRGYVYLHQMVRGLDYLVLSLVLFGVAVVVSLTKGGLLFARVQDDGGEDDPPPTLGFPPDIGTAEAE